MGEIAFEQARDYALRRLERELSPKLFFHSLRHTRDDVVLATERLAEMEGVSGESLLLLLTAAYYHDIGFVELKGEAPTDEWRRFNHEELSVEICLRELPRFGYSVAQILVIRGIILATRLPQTPYNLMEEIMADADLDSLGRMDFWRTSMALRKELEAFGQEYTDEAWLTAQARFLEGHSYFTPSAVRLRKEQKDQNIQQCFRLLHFMRRSRVTEKNSIEVAINGSSARDGGSARL